MVRLILILLILAAVGMYLSLVPGRSDAQPLRHALSEEIARAKEIRVIEHSNQWDYLPKDNSVHHEEKVYKEVTLTPAQRNDLVRALVPYTEPVGVIVSRMCIFEPHHRIEMVDADNSAHTVEICFVCDEIDSGSGEKILPDGWDKSLRAFISSLSMRPDGPWMIDETSTSDHK